MSDADRPRPGDRDDLPDVDVDAAFAAIIAGWALEGHNPKDDPGPPDPPGPDSSAPGQSDPAQSSPGPLSPGAAGPQAAAPARPGAARPGADPARPVGRHQAAPADPERRAQDPQRRPGPPPDPKHLAGRAGGPPLTPDPWASRGPVPAEDEGYQPPDPPPVQLGSWSTRLAWAGVLGGPLLLVIAVLSWQSMPRPLALLGVAAFVAGFAVLVARLPLTHDEDDDGAQV